jgi:hypothetical protein
MGQGRGGVTVSDRGGGGRDRDAVAVGAAMLRYRLPDAGAESVQLEVSRDDEGTWLRLTFPVSDGITAEGDPGELMVVDSIADRWGAQGGTELPSTLWALLR